MNSFILGSNGIGGAEVLTRALNRHLQGKNHSQIIYLDTLDNKLFTKIKRYIYIIYKCVQSKNIIAATEGNTYIIAAILSLLCKKRGIIWVHSILSDYYKGRSYYLKFIILLLNNVDTVICCSEDVRDDLSRLGINNLRLIRNPLLPQKKSSTKFKNTNYSIKSVSFRYFGRLSKIKGIHKIIKQSHKIKAKFKVPLVLQGPREKGLRIPINNSLKYRKESNGYAAIHNATLKFGIHAPETESFGLTLLEQATHGEKIIWLSKHNAITKTLSKIGILCKNQSLFPNYYWCIRKLLRRKSNIYLENKIKNIYSYGFFLKSWELLLDEL